MNISIEKIDDINFILSGDVENKLIEEKVAAIKTEIKKDEEQSDEQIEQTAIEKVFREFIDEGIAKANIKLDDLLGQPGLKKYEKKADSIYFEVELATSPEVNLDVDLSDIIPTYTAPTAAPEEVEKKMNEFVEKQAPFTPIETPRAVENGDTAVIDFVGYMDDKPFEGGSAEKFNLKVGSQSFIAGFEEQIIGMEYGEERTITVTFPEAYQADDLAGKEAKFVVTLHEIQEQKATEPDDEFAKRILNDQSATLETLKQKFADQVVSQELSEIYMTTLKPQIISGLVSKFDFTLPNNIVEQEIDAKVRERIQTLSPEEQKEYMEDKDKFFILRDSVKDEARTSIKKAIIVEALAKKENVTADEQEAISALTYQAMMSGQNAQELVKFHQDNNLMGSVKLALLEDKLFGQMLGFHNQ